jgi:hypothetical protein
MNAVELEAYKLDQNVTSNIQNAETSMDIIETYYGYIKNKEIVINSVNSNIDSLYQLVSDTYERVLDTNTPLTSLDGFNQIIIDAKDLAESYYDIGITANDDITEYLNLIEVERKKIEQYEKNINEDQESINELVSLYS